ncbi:MAG: sigma-70 family RNA polymerase sigma factor [Pseudomonadota bacterium]
MSDKREPEAEPESTRSSAEVLCDLADRIASGDGGAENQFIAIVYRPTLQLARRYAGDKDLSADDLAQEALMRVLQRLRTGSLHKGSNLTAYVAAVVRNVAINQHRRHASAQTYSDVDEQLDPGPGPQTTTELIEEVERCLSALQEATSRDREILRRLYLHEEGKQSICASLGVTSRQFDRLLYRARSRFRAIFDRAVGEPTR